MTRKCSAELWQDQTPRTFEQHHGVAMEVSMAVFRDALEWRGQWAWRGSIFNCVEIELAAHHLRRLRSES